jgi:hypothetical protein
LARSPDAVTPATSDDATQIEARTMTSQARIKANRNNARQSTGPKTAEGKARSRLNGLVHGLRSEQVVLPTEDPTAFDEHLAEWLDEWKPPTVTRRQLVERLAATAWRLNRCVRIETARFSERTLDALEQWDRTRGEQIESAVSDLPADPRTTLRWLKQSRLGVDRVIELSEDLIEVLGNPGGWSEVDRHHVRLLNLVGLTTDDPEAAEYAMASWRLLLANRPELVEPDSPAVFPPEIADQVRESFRRHVASNVVLLRDLREQLPDPSATRIRQAEIAAFEFQPQDLSLQRYEGQLDREYRMTLNQLISLTKTRLDLVDETFAPTEPNPGTANPQAPTEPNRPGKTTEVSAKSEVKADAPAKSRPRSRTPEPVAPTEPKAQDTLTPSPTVDRDRGGRIWPVPGVEIGSIDQ